MKKINIVLISLLFFVSKTFAQPAQGIVAYDKKDIICYTIEVPFTADLAEDAVKKQFKKMGAKGKERKGFWEFENVIIPVIRKDYAVDAYIKVERKSRKEKDVSIITMFVTEPGVPPGTNESIESAARGAKPEISEAGILAMMSSFKDNTEDHNLSLELQNMEDEVKKAEKLNDELIKEGDDLQKKLKKVQEDIADNSKNKSKQAEELTKKRELLAELKARSVKTAQ